MCYSEAILIGVIGKPNFHRSISLVVMVKFPMKDHLSSHLGLKVIENFPVDFLHFVTTDLLLYPNPNSDYRYFGHTILMTDHFYFRIASPKASF